MALLSYTLKTMYKHVKTYTYLTTIENSLEISKDLSSLCSWLSLVKIWSI
jgi:hypothetical protein